MAPVGGALDPVRGGAVRAVAQQPRRVADDGGHVDGRGLALRRPRVAEEIADGLVQAIRFAQHDVEELRLIGLELELLAQHLHRAGHRGQRVADLVGDAGGHLADRGQPLLRLGLALQPLQLGDVLEREEIAGARRRHQRPDRDAHVQLPAVAQRERVDHAPAAAGGDDLGQGAAQLVGQLQDLHRALAADERGVMAGDRLGGAVEHDDAAVGVGRRQAARHAVDDVLVEGLQIGNRRRRGAQAHVGAVQALGQVAGEPGHGHERDDVDADRVERVARTGQRQDGVGQAPVLGPRDDQAVLRGHDQAEADAAPQRDGHAAARQPQHAAAEDRQHVERDEVGVEAAGQDDDGRDDADVDDQLRLDQPRPARMDAARGEVEHGQRRHRLQQVEGELARQPLRARRVDEQPGAEDQPHQQRPEGDQPEQPPPLSVGRGVLPDGRGRRPRTRRGRWRVNAGCHTGGLGSRTYESFSMSLKIGMYIEMTMPPTMMPRMAIITGSSRVIRPATAVSTSSS